MRNVARLKMGYYPLPEAEGVKLRSLLSFAGPASVIDPCVGQGTALHLVTSDAAGSALWCRARRRTCADCQRQRH